MIPFSGNLKFAIFFDYFLKALTSSLLSTSSESDNDFMESCRATALLADLEVNRHLFYKNYRIYCRIPSLLAIAPLYNLCKLYSAPLSVSG